MPYASKTKVPVGQSRLEIERILVRYGATEFGFISATAGGKAQVGCRLRDRMLRFQVEIPADVKNPEQEARRRWRALALVLKAKLEAVESGIAGFDEEFLARIVVPGDGRTLAEIYGPQLDELYRTKKMPNLLPAKA
jgi:hypothetical protein